MKTPVVFSVLSMWLAGVAGAAEKIPLRVLYAGDPGTAHTKSFGDFLGKHFTAVESLAVLDLASADLSKADVLVVDGAVLDRSGKDVRIKAHPRGLTLEKLSIPTVLIGGMGGLISDDLTLKLGWGYG